MRFFESLKRNSKYIALIISVLIVFHHLIFIINNSVNIPESDDYDAVLRFANKYIETISFQGKIKLIFSLHNEHRIVLDRLFVLADIVLFGQINFIHLMFIGNLFLICIFLVMTSIYRKAINFDSWLWFIPIPFLLFNLNTYNNYLWGMAAVANIGVLVFAILSIVVMFSDIIRWSHYKRLGLSLAFAVIATFTSGNGLLTLLICLTGLLFNRHWKSAIIWIMVSALVLFIYFFDFTRNDSPGIIATITSQPGQLLSHFFIVVGNYFSRFNQFGYWIVGAFGVLILATFAYFTFFKRLYKTDFSNFGILLFLFGSCLLISLSRSHSGVAQASVSRYVIYSNLLVMVLYVITINKAKMNSVFSYLIWGVFAVFCVWNFFSFRDTAKDEQRSINLILEEGAKTFNKEITHSISYPDQSDATIILLKSEELGIYGLSEENTLERESLHPDEVASMPEETGGLTYNFESIKNEPDMAVLSGWAFASKNDVDMKLVLTLGTRHFVFPCQKLERGDVMANFANSPGYSGFRTIVLSRYIPDGEYVIGLQIDDGDIYFQNTTFKVSFSGRENRIARKYAWETNDGHYNFDDIDSNDGIISINGWAYLIGLDNTKSKIQLTLESTLDVKIFDMQLKQRPDLNPFFHREDLLNCGFETKIEKDKLKEGTHSVGLLIENHDRYNFILTDNFVIVSPKL